MKLIYAAAEFRSIENVMQPVRYIALIKFQFEAEL